MSFYQWFLSGGWAMWVELYFGVPGISFAIIHLFAKSKWSRVVSIGLLAVTAVTALAGTLYGRRLVQQAVEIVEPAVRDELLRLGYAEAWVPLQFGAALVAIGALVLVIPELNKQPTR